jgi:hypothetical protein
MRTYSWGADELGAICITAAEAELTVLGSEGDRVELSLPDCGLPEIEESEGACPASQPHVEGRILSYVRTESGTAHISLSLPRSYGFSVEFSAARGSARVRKVSASLRLRLGHGDISCEAVRGRLDAFSGKGDLSLVDCDAPEGDSSLSPESTAVVPGFSGLGLDGLLVQTRSGPFSELPQGELGPGGMRLAALDGTIRLRRIKAEGLGVGCVRGHVSLEAGSVGELAVYVAHGDVDLSSAEIRGDWRLETADGHLHCALPEGTKARIDAAVRDGKLLSPVQLVRVARPGPESARSLRMVGSIGLVDEASPRLFCSAAKGDIRLSFARPPHSRAKDGARQSPDSGGQNAPERECATAGASGMDGDECDGAQAFAPPPGHRDELELFILESLRNGAIGVDEADRLLSQIGSEE